MYQLNLVIKSMDLGPILVAHNFHFSNLPAVWSQAYLFTFLYFSSNVYTIQTVIQVVKFLNELELKILIA